VRRGGSRVTATPVYHPLSVGMGQLGSQWTDIHEIVYIFQKSVEKFYFKKKDKISRYVTWRSVYIFFFHVWLISSYIEKCSRKKVEKLETHFMSKIFFFENRAFYEIMWNNILDRGRPQMTT
jgi:hypothetical protein